MTRGVGNEKKTERLYIRTTSSMKMNLQIVANLKHGGNLNQLIDVALKEYVDRHREG